MEAKLSFNDVFEIVDNYITEKNLQLRDNYTKFRWAIDLHSTNKSKEQICILLDNQVKVHKLDREVKNIDIISGTEAAYINPISVAEQRKQQPVFSGVLQYFPDAILEVANTSWVGNNQHHPDKPLHWDKNKSTDELDALTRHLMQAGTFDTDGVRHSAKAAWRALANLQREIDLHRLDIKKGH